MADVRIWARVASLFGVVFIGRAWAGRNEPIGKVAAASAFPKTSSRLAGFPLMRPVRRVVVELMEMVKQ
jgi:1-acyl-sn-glycerol-3-phosphate acyltransferase